MCNINFSKIKKSIRLRKNTNYCFKCTPECTVPSLIFQKTNSGKGLMEPHRPLLILSQALPSIASDSAIYIYLLIYLWTEVLWFIYLVHWTLACNKCVYYYYYYLEHFAPSVWALPSVLGASPSPLPSPLGRFIISFWHYIVIFVLCR